MDPESTAAIPLLAVLNPRERAEVLRSARERTFAPGEVVVNEGDPAVHLYLVARGNAHVERDGIGVVGRLGPGDFFGELGLIEKHGRTATVVADDELTCVMLSAWEFGALLKEHPQMAIPMLHALIARQHRRESHRG